MEILRGGSHDQRGLVDQLLGDDPGIRVDALWLSTTPAMGAPIAACETIGTWHQLVRVIPSPA